MKMISTIDTGGEKGHTTNSICNSRRKPLQLLTGIFTRKNRRDNHNNNSGQLMQQHNSEEEDQSLDKNPYLNEDADQDLWGDGSSGILEPREALHSPYHARTIDQDMENLRLSRQDNPYLQVLASRECLNESDDCSEYEEKHLMSKENLGGSSRDPLTVAEVHARLVRSPPPIMWTKGRNSEPSFSRFLTSSVDGDCVFQFPPTSRLMSPTNSCRSHHSGPAGMSGYKFLAPFDYNSRIRDNTLECVSKFNLSPQPRRRPETKVRTFSDLTS